MIRNQEPSLRRAGSAITLLFTSLAAGVATTAPAQVALDGKLGSAGPISGPNFSIPAELGAIRGDNLFHSFSQFNLAAAESATFSGPANIQNILARVTGGSASSIDGTIRSEIAGANLFLLNPKGVVFGPNASIDVTGSFAVSTADYLGFADGARFVASLDADDSALSSAPVAEFGFLGASPSSVTIDKSTLTVPDSKDISVVAGDILLDGGTLRAKSGQIKLSSEGGTIALQNSSHVDGSGEAGGRIVIRGGKLSIDNSRIEANNEGSGAGRGIEIALTDDLRLSNAGQINSLSPAGLGSGGDIHVKSKSIHMDGGGLIDEETFNPTTQISAATGDPFGGGGPAAGGNIEVETGRLEMVNSAQISSASFGSGDAGNIMITAESILVDAQLVTPTQITANTQAFEDAGKAGDIIIKADTFDLLNGATILAASFGSAAAGEIDLEARSVNLLGGAIITAGTFGSGPGGNVKVTASHLRIDGTSSEEGGMNLLTGIQAVTTSSSSPAPGGDIQTQSDSLEIANGGSIFTTSYGQGVGGDISIRAGALRLDHDASIRAAGEADGAAGNISVDTTGSVRLANGSSIATSAPGSSGGNIDLRSGSEMRLANSEITARAGLDGGNISLHSPTMIYLQQSTLTAEADTTGSGFGNGGNLTLEPSVLLLRESELISKSSFGNGGNIFLKSDVFFQSSSLIDASAPFGIPGAVQVTAPQVDLSGVLVVLASNFIDASTLLRPDCGMRLGGSISSFIVMGRGGLPIMAGGFVPSSVVGEAHAAK